MKRLQFLQILFLLMLCSCDSCDEIDYSEMPPETQTGANTIGCYVDGELVRNDGTILYVRKTIEARFQRNMDMLSISVYTKIGSVGFRLENPTENVKITALEAFFTPRPSSPECDCFGGRGIGEFILTKFDTENLIVSGRFQFQGRCTDVLFRHFGDSTVNVTDGRFDIQLDIY
jgi:hypothetical protein